MASLGGPLPVPDIRQNVMILRRNPHRESVTRCSHEYVTTASAYQELHNTSIERQ